MFQNIIFDLTFSGEILAKRGSPGRIDFTTRTCVRRSFAEVFGILVAGCGLSTPQRTAQVVVRPAVWCTVLTLHNSLPAEWADGLGRSDSRTRVGVTGPPDMHAWLWRLKVTSWKPLQSNTSSWWWFGSSDSAVLIALASLGEMVSLSPEPTGPVRS